MRQAAHFLIVLGGVLALVGLFLRTGVRLPVLGKLPGDIVIRKGNFGFYLPLGSGLLLSLLVSLILLVISRLAGKG